MFYIGNYLAINQREGFRTKQLIRTKKYFFILYSATL